VTRPRALRYHCGPRPAVTSHPPRIRERLVRTDEGEEITVRGVQASPFRDVYHLFLRASWPVALALAVGGFLAMNALFALAYLAVGGVSGARPGSLFDAYAFSVETMATIGYGEMHPASPAAHLLVIVEAVVGLLVTALFTGLAFAKFSQPTARIVFSDKIAYGPVNGLPTLSFRVGNERGNNILEATVRVVMVRTEPTREGGIFYKMYDLPLVRERSPAISRSWNAMHVVEPGGLLHGYTPETLQRDEVELIVTVVGTDDTSLQPVHARKRYRDGDIAWGARLADVLTAREDGSLVLDLERFHDVLPTAPTDAFPYAIPAGDRDA
jgi:inward rectifier potassium channel